MERPEDHTALAPAVYENTSFEHSVMVEDCQMVDHAFWLLLQPTVLATADLCQFGIRSEIANPIHVHEQFIAELEALSFEFGGKQYEVSQGRTLLERVHVDHLKECLPINFSNKLMSIGNSVLHTINRDSKPKLNSFNLLVLNSVKYILPVCWLLQLLTHNMATDSDIRLFFEFADRAWCFPHPLGREWSGSDRLDNTCRKIGARFCEVFGHADEQSWCASENIKTREQLIEEHQSIKNVLALVDGKIRRDDLVDEAKAKRARRA